MAHIIPNIIKSNQMQHPSIFDSNLTLEGSLPSWLQGTLYFVGPSHADHVPGNKYDAIHLFDGLAQLHAITIEPNTLHYAAQFVESDAFKNFRKTGKINFNGFGQTYYRSWPKKLFALLMPELEGPEIPNTSFGIISLNNKLVSKSHRGFVTHNPSTLFTETSIKNPNKQSYQVPHIYYDQASNQYITVSVEYGDKNACVISTIDATGEQTTLSRIETPLLHYIHTFSVTENYILLTLCPFVAQGGDISAGLTSFIQNFTWKPQLGTEFLVIDKKTGEVVKRYTFGSFFTLYHINAYEQDHRIIVDILTYPDATIINNYYLDKLNTQQQHSAMVTRYTLAEHDIVWNEIISHQSIDYVTINAQHAGKPYQYIYGSEFNPGHITRHYNYISKIDLKNYALKRWYKPFCYPSEPVFIAAPHAVKEDEGVLVSLVYNAQENRSFMLFFDAIDLKEIARVYFAYALPYPLRGIYLKN